MARELPGIATNGQSEAVRLTAIRDALDRAGLKPPTQVELEAAGKPDFESSVCYPIGSAPFMPRVVLRR